MNEMPELFAFIKQMKEEQTERNLNPTVSLTLDLFVTEAVEVLKLIEKMRTSEVKK